jgi:hypothetical protein
LAAHFLPFERAALAPDDYASLVRSFGPGSGAAAYDERPLNRLFLTAQSAAAGDNANRGFALLLLSDALLVVSVYMLLDKLLKDPALSFLASAFFCVTPNTLEIYQSAIYANVAVVSAVYVLCLYLFLKYIDGGNRWLLVFSAALYAAGIFWYETGFFTPAIAAVAALEVKGGRKHSWLVYIPLMAVYAGFRIASGMPSAAGAEAHAVSVSIIPFNLLETARHYAGRYIARSVIYGFYRFAAMSLPLLASCSLLALASGYLAAKTAGKCETTRPNSRQLLISFYMAVFWLLPILLNSNGGVGGRHLLLPSIGVSVLGIALLRFSGANRRCWRQPRSCC